MNRLTKLIFILIFLLASSEISAQGCPNKTLVEKDKVTFVGEVTSLGGDNFVEAWFEYGKTDAYGKSTTQVRLTNPTRYCVSVTDISPCTTYHYRAVARNSSGISYGEDKTFTTICPQLSVSLLPTPSSGCAPLSVDVKAEVSGAVGDSLSYYFDCNNDGIWDKIQTSNLSSLTIPDLCRFSNPGNYTLMVKVIEKEKSAMGSASVSVASCAGQLDVSHIVRNLSDGTSYSKEVSGDPGEIIEIKLIINNSSQKASNVTILYSFSQGVSSVRNVRIDGSPVSGDPRAGINIGIIPAGGTKTILFEASLEGADKFSVGENIIVGTAKINFDSQELSDTIKVRVVKGVVAGVTSPTRISTGLLKNPLLNYLILPLIISATFVSVFKPKILRFENWKREKLLDLRHRLAKEKLELKIQQGKQKNQV